MRINAGRYIAKLADSEAEVAAAQALRYAVFVKEMGAEPSDADRAAQRERDRFDPFCRHLILIDAQARGDPGALDRVDDGRVVGVYRLLHRSDALAAHGPGFYTSGEYDLSPLFAYEREIMELGRSCVAADHRGGGAMQLLWLGLSQYIDRHDIGLMFGTASFHGKEIEPLSAQLSLLHHRHLAPAHLRPRALDDHYVAMDLTSAEAVDRTVAMQSMPTLIKGYLRLGGFVGDGAFIDVEFNTVDVCLVMETDRIKGRYKSFYARRAQSDLTRLLG